MGGELPPHHHRSPSSQSSEMPNGTRLPSIAELELEQSSQPQPSAHLYHNTNSSSDPRWDPVLRQSVDVAIPQPTSPTGPFPDHQPSGTAPANSNSKLSSWTAINHSVQNSGLASPSSGRPQQLSPHQHPITPKQHANSNPRDQIGTFRPKSWPPPSAFKQESTIAEKPITARRQDSAVSVSSASTGFRSTLNPATSSSVFSFRVGQSTPDSSQASLPRDALNYPNTPPSPAPSPVPDPNLAQSHSAHISTQPSRHGRRRKTPPESRRHQTLSVITRRERAHSDSRVTSSSLSISSLMSPNHGTINDTSVDGDMPPPPNPPSVAPGATPGSQVSGIGGSSTTNSTQRGPLSEPRGDHSHANQRSLPDSAISTAPFDFGNPSPPRCLHCHDVWTYPPPDTSPFRHQGPSNSIREMEQSMTGLSDFLKKYGEQKDKAYQEWAQWHKTEPGHPDTVVPCMRESAAQNNKRKSNVPADDGQVTSKFRRLSCNTPSPRPTQLTPPPEPTSTSPPNQPSGAERFHPYANTNSGDTFYVSPQVATILGLQGAPPARFEKPADDASNMWSDPARERKGTSSEPQPDNSASPDVVENPTKVDAGEVTSS